MVEQLDRLTRLSSDDWKAVGIGRATYYRVNKSEFDSVSAMAERVINPDNADNAETNFAVVGQSFASAVEAQKRNERAKAWTCQTQSKWIEQAVKSNLDDHSAFIINELSKGTFIEAF